MNDNDFKTECDRIEKMSRDELKIYLDNLGDEMSNPNEDLSISMKKTICFNRAHNRLSEITNSMIRKRMQV